MATPGNYRKLHYSRTHVWVARLSRLLSFSYTQRHGLIKGMRRKGGLGFLPERLAHKETAETRFFQSLALSGKVVYDVGAFQGLMTLFFARDARRVITYEPNPVSHARAAENIRLNKLQNVMLRNVGVGAEAGELRLVYDPLMPGAASGDPMVGGQISDMAEQVRQTTVRVVRLDDDIRGSDLPAPDLMKVDVEGMELGVLRGAKDTLVRTHPALYIELHGADESHKTANARAVVEYLRECGYANILNVETGTPVRDEIGRPLHIYATA